MKARFATRMLYFTLLGSWVSWAGRGIFQGEGKSKRRKYQGTYSRKLSLFFFRGFFLCVTKEEKWADGRYVFCTL